MSSRNLLAPELYAMANDKKCEGKFRCHWCGAACSDYWLNDDPPPIPFLRSTSAAKHASELYVCIGCWLFRRGSITVNYLDKTYKDRQKPMNLSWLITQDRSWVIRKEDKEKLYDFLFKPTIPFVLSLVTEGVNHLQLCSVNSPEPLQADSVLEFTLNNTIHNYSIYELEETMLNRDEVGKSPGIQALVRIFGFYEAKEHKPTKRERGRPPKMEDGRVTKKAVG